MNLDINWDINWEIILLLLLIFVTAYYAIQTKRLVRANIKPLIFANDPDDFEWQVDIEKVDSTKRPKSRYLRVKALIVNPGITPITLERFSEKLITNGGKEASIEGRFIQPKIASTDRHGLYVFAIPWVTVHDDFSIWYRVYELNDDADENHKLKITFKYKVGNKNKTIVKELDLKAHNPL